MKSTEAESAQSKNHLIILLVEDHKDTREAIQMWLERKDHTVFATDTCKSAIQIAGKKSVNLLVCDIRLPDGEGWPLLKKVRAAAAGDAPIYGISMSCYGHSDIEMAAKSREAGYETHLVKPCPAEDMAKAIEHVQALTICVKTSGESTRTRRSEKRASSNLRQGRAA